MRANPKGVELIDGGFHKLGVVGKDSCLKIAAELAFHTDACTGEVCRTHIDRLQIKNQHLEVHPRTQHSFQAGGENGIFVEILTEIRSRLFGVDQADTHATLEQSGNLSQQGNSAVALFHIQILNVGRANPQRFMHRGNPRNHLGVMLLVGNILNERGQFYLRFVEPQCMRLYNVCLVKMY